MRTDRMRVDGREDSDLDRPIWEQPAASDDGYPAGADATQYLDVANGPPVPAVAPARRSGRHQAVPEKSRLGSRDDEPSAGRDQARPSSHSSDAADPATNGARDRPRGSLVRTGIRGLGQTLITGGLIVLLFVVYELFITDLMTDQRQEELTDELVQNWENDDPTLGPDLPGGGLSQIPIGDGFAFIRIPALGADYVRVVVEGTTTDALTQGPGHYVDSAMPGELGNFSLAGHRTGKGSPFIDLDVLAPGDAVVIETADTYFTYRVLGDPATGDFGADASGIPGQQIVSPQDVEVVYPIPGVDDSTIVPTSAYLTLTTCHPKFSNEQRLIIHAVLDGPGLPKAEYPDGPPALTEN